MTASFLGLKYTRPRIRTENLSVLSGVPLPVELVGHIGGQDGTRTHTVRLLRPLSPTVGLLGQDGPPRGIRTHTATHLKRVPPTNWAIGGKWSSDWDSNPDCQASETCDSYQLVYPRKIGREPGNRTHAHSACKVEITTRWTALEEWSVAE